MPAEESPGYSLTVIRQHTVYTSWKTYKFVVGVEISGYYINIIFRSMPVVPVGNVDNWLF